MVHHPILLRQIALSLPLLFCQKLCLFEEVPSGKKELQIIQIPFVTLSSKSKFNMYQEDGMLRKKRAHTSRQSFLL
jgi:hypothetical protein